MIIKKFGFAAAAAMAAVSLSGNAEARRLILADTLDFCGVQDFNGPIPTDGSTTLDIATYDAQEAIDDFGTTCQVLTDPRTTQNPFSVNIGGTLYDEVHVSENGIIGFGGAVTADPSTGLFDLLMPAIAPFFADSVILSDIRFGYSQGGEGSFWLTYSRMGEEGGDPSEDNTFQVILVNQGSGDFDLIFNYVGIEWNDDILGAQAGFTYGNGGGLLIDGAGDPDGYLGSWFEDDPTDLSNCIETSLACSLAFNDGTGPGSIDDNGEIARGYFKFEFRDGEAVGFETTPVPIPPAFALFIAAFAGLMRIARK